MSTPESGDPQSLAGSPAMLPSISDCPWCNSLLDPGVIMWKLTKLVWHKPNASWIAKNWLFSGDSIAYGQNLVRCRQCSTVVLDGTTSSCPRCHGNFESGAIFGNKLGCFWNSKGQKASVFKGEYLGVEFSAKHCRSCKRYILETPNQA
ncbi:PF20097 family protein [Geothrix sp.]|uniref:PF20097 family protein n=2 Tax=Geothrix sp. TaxID=1962974 RepID=UPI00342961CD